MLGAAPRSVRDDAPIFRGETVVRLLKEIHPDVFISEETACASARFLEPKAVPLRDALIDEDPGGLDPQLVASAVWSVLLQEPYRSVFLQGGQCQVRTSLLENQECLAPFFSSPQFQ